MAKTKIVDPEDTILFDGVCYVLTRNIKESKLYIDYTCDYSDGISLLDIEEKYPHVFMVIFEEHLNGKVYRYGNHEDYWEEVGETNGFA